MRRRHRLSGRRAFSAVRDRRASASAAHLRVSVAESPATGPRVGLIVPRAVGGAVVRNRVRRRCGAVLRRRLGELAGLDVVIMVRDAGAAQIPFPVLVAEIDGCLERARGRLTAAEPRSDRDIGDRGAARGDAGMGDNVATHPIPPATPWPLRPGATPQTS